MSKSYWMKEQNGNFSNNQEDTFDPTNRYIGIRLQQGVPLLDRDWNELEDIRRYEELILREKYIGNGTPDDGFKISAFDPPASDFKISAGRCIVDGFEAVNEPDTDDYARSYLDQKDKVPLTPLSEGGRTDIVYLDVWIGEITGREVPDLKNSDVNDIVTCVRHKVEWRVRVDEGGEGYDKKECHHYYDLAEIKWKDGNIIEVEDLMTTKLKLTSVKAELKEVRSTSASKDELEEVRQATVNRWIEGGEIEYERSEKEYKSKISEMLCIIGGQEIKFDKATSSGEIKEDENFVVLARANGSKKEIEFIVTRKNLLEWLNSWTFEKWMQEKEEDYTEPVLKSAFSLPLYFFETVGAKEFKKTDLRHHGDLDTWLTELAGRLDAPERRMCRVPLLQQTIFGRAVPVETVSVGPNPSGVAFDGAHIWVSNSGDNSVSKININTNDVVESVSVGSLPHGVAFDGAHIWVSNPGDHSVSKININTNDVVESVSVGRLPHGVAFDGAHIWVANSGDYSVSKININTNDEVASVSVGTNPRGVAFDGAHVWVFNSGGNSVSKININTNDVVASVSVGTNPKGVTFDGAHIWVSNSGDNSVSKININTNDVVASVSVGTNPRGVAFDGAHIWVINYVDNSVSKILRGDLR